MAKRGGIRPGHGPVVAKGLMPGPFPDHQSNTSMHRIIKFSLIALLSSSSLSVLQAQELRLGGGYTGSNVRQSGSENWSGQAGYQLGIDVILGQRFFLKPGLHLLVRNLNYTLLGVGQDGLPNGQDNEYRYTSRSLRIPILLGLRLIDPLSDPEFNLYVLGGPTVLVLINDELDNNSLEISTQSSQWYLGFGGGMEYKFLFLEAGYDVGLSNLFSGNS
jgi:hypothetical protein